MNIKFLLVTHGSQVHSGQGRRGCGGAAKLSAFGGKFGWAIVCWRPHRCLLYGVRRRPLLRGFKCISIMGSSIGGSGTVHSRGSVCAMEGPLIEVSMYTLFSSIQVSRVSWRASCSCLWLLSRAGIFSSSDSIFSAICVFRT